MVKLAHLDMIVGTPIKGMEMDSLVNEAVRIHEDFDEVITEVRSISDMLYKLQGRFLGEGFVVEMRGFKDDVANIVKLL